MFASLIGNLLDWRYLITSPLTLIVLAFQLWMFIHAIRNREWLWAIFIFIGWGITAILYFFFVYRATSSSIQGFELPGAGSRKRIKELQAQIHHLDNAYHHFQLGDLYFRRGKLVEAEKCYRDALQRDPQDIDARAHLGQCLVRMNRPAEARPILEGIMHEKPDHDYGYTMMALAEALMALGETDNAIQYWQHIAQGHSYPRAKVQLAELYAAKNQKDLARAELKDVLSDDVHAPAFQRKRDRVWIHKAKALLNKLS
ncbi:MAG TPA: tetratricopeptide repeat protein [Verrucomicrobiae bacterium]|nr:tetratricopeptide repeat protein [Verrucomicrobiae bacterium]